MDDRKKFLIDAENSALRMGEDSELKNKAYDLIAEADRYNWSYQWTWLGVPIIQMPSDMVAIQEIIWNTRPDLIIETGIARGGSLILSASILELLGEGKVLGVDIDIRPHNRDAIASHPLSKRIELIQADALATELHERLAQEVSRYSRVMVILDSNHTHDYVLEELKIYAEYVSIGQYLVVADTVIEHIPPQVHRPRPWGPGNNPATAVSEFLKNDSRFVQDKIMNSKVLISSSPGGYLIRNE